MGFEPTELFTLNNFQDCRFRPLSHPTAQYFTRKRVACQRKVLFTPLGISVQRFGVQCDVMPRAIAWKFACLLPRLFAAGDTVRAAEPGKGPKKSGSSYLDVVTDPLEAATGQHRLSWISERRRLRCLRLTIGKRSTLPRENLR